MTTDTAVPPAGTDPRHLARRQVALLIGPSEQFVVGMFAAWQAGLGILPLPPAFPDERLGVMLRDCAPRVLLTLPEHQERAAELIARYAPGTGLVVDDGTGPDIPATDVPVPVGDAAAFTVYTSGSTGRPKGVLVRHAHLSPLIRWFGETFAMGEGVRIAQTLSLGFDFGLQELFTSLPYGACLVIPEPEDRRDACRYARFLRKQEVTALYTTPSFAQEVAATGEPLPALRVVLLGGEVLTGSAVRALRRIVAPDCRLFNGYGPTEATVNCLVYEVPKDLQDDALPAVLPVGRATSGSWVRIVDDAGRPLPVGAVGELLIGGNGVTGGYLGRPEQTVERFVEVPASTGPGGWGYRSGDLGYVLPGGDFVVVGRVDRQVKIRGFRVEPGEIEEVLAGCRGVTAAAVRPLGGPRRLVAFVTGDATAEAARAYVAERLPAAMVPEQIVPLDRIPLNANGKADEAALVELAERDHVPWVDPGAGSAELEAAVCEVWGRVLGIDPPPGHANVFDLGAHSLVALQAHHRLQTALGVDFPPHYLFEYPQPRALAERLHAERAAASAAPSTDPQPVTAKDTR
ncbi:amino acid adenylation domain-containing protein [Streptomyces sp. HK10]|uniref:non-ribosomal peptide synthetase n=1 Tax=Streptomyces sp. HK10 TaxID=3373255 RepID=UPI003747AAEE